MIDGDEQVIGERFRRDRTPVMLEYLRQISVRIECQADMILDAEVGFLTHILYIVSQISHQALFA